MSRYSQYSQQRLLDSPQNPAGGQLPLYEDTSLP